MPLSLSLLCVSSFPSAFPPIHRCFPCFPSSTSLSVSFVRLSLLSQCLHLRTSTSLFLSIECAKQCICPKLFLDFPTSLSGYDKSWRPWWENSSVQRSCHGYQQVDIHAGRWRWAQSSGRRSDSDLVQNNTWIMDYLKRMRVWFCIKVRLFLTNRLHFASKLVEFAIAFKRVFDSWCGFILFYFIVEIMAKPLPRIITCGSKVAGKMVLFRCV